MDVTDPAGSIMMVGTATNASTAMDGIAGSAAAATLGMAEATGGTIACASVRSRSAKTEIA